MDRVFSARVDEATVHQIDLLASELRKSKKAILEESVALYASQVREKSGVDPLERSFGAWKRKESAQQTANEVREAFNESFRRHKR